jgi:hypothetical protein
MVEKVERRVLSTGDVLVFAAALASMIFVSREQIHALGSEGPTTWKEAKAMVDAGQATELQAAEVARITAKLEAVGLLTGTGDWPPLW